MILVITLLCLVPIGQTVHGTVITVNENGRSSPVCCVYGTCVCSSFYNALSSIKNNTVINITSQAISLHTNVSIGSGNLMYNITITSKDGTVVMCNNTGSVSCDMCSEVVIKTITWDQCGDISNPTIPGITFHGVSNIFMINCIFQHFKVCTSVHINKLLGTIKVMNCSFMFNTITNASLCSGNHYSSLLVTSANSTEMMIYDSVFHHNGHALQSNAMSGSLLYISSYSQPVLSILVKNTRFTSNGIIGMYIYDTSITSEIIFDMVVVNYNNGYGGLHLEMLGSMQGSLLNIISSHFAHNDYQALNLQLLYTNCTLHNTSFVNNTETALYASKSTNSTITVSLCNFFGNIMTFSSMVNIVMVSDSMINISLSNFYDNIGDNILNIAMLSSSTVNMLQCNFSGNVGNSYSFHDNSIVSIAMDSKTNAFCNVVMISSNFMGNKIGSALRVSNCFLKFYSSTLFHNNSARIGAALYILEGSQISVGDGATVQFINNTASLRGGAMYIDLTNCHDHGIVFTNFTRYDSISFINNSAKLSGNSIYFNIPDSCDVIRDYTNNDSIVYVPYKFHYTPSHNVVGLSIATSPYEVEVCSPSKCDIANGTKIMRDDVMLGETVYFNTTLHDYFGTAAEALKFQVTCTNCGSNYKLLNNRTLIQNEIRGKVSILLAAGETDVKNDINITLNFSSLLSPEYTQLTATLSLTLSSCNNGFLFSKQSQQCECYNSNNKDNCIHCVDDYASIKLGYWFGYFCEKHTFSLCHNDYCNFFTHREETRSGIYNLPEEMDDQCNSHRTGVACGQCSEGYTLAYNSPYCISVEKCSPGMTVLVIILTILYWIVIITMLFGVAYFLNTQQISPGYLYGITFFYSIVDILLVTNLHRTNGVFYTASILSSFAKLNPQFFGQLCFIKDLDAIDQQFIHYFHVVFVSIILIVIYITAKCHNRALLYVNRYIVQVTCYVLLFSYISLTSSSLLLLRAIKFKDVDGLYTYLSPHLKYFANRHAAYASVAILCILLVTIGFPLSLVMEPLIIKMFEKRLNKSTWIKIFTKKKIVIKFKQLLNQVQDCYKDQHHWFAAYYLICGSVIMLITYFANDDYNYMIYYLQTACVIVTMTHIWIQPYKNDLLNVMDAVLLLIMLLIINLSTFNFSPSATTGIAISLMIAPLLLLLGVGVKKLLVPKMKTIQSSLENNFGELLSNPR